jgi:hypothetical protein
VAGHWQGSSKRIGKSHRGRGGFSVSSGFRQEEGSIKAQFTVTTYLTDYNQLVNLMKP